MESQVLTLEQVTELNDVEQCKRYLILKETDNPETHKPYTMQQIAEMFGITTREGMHARVKSWEKRGILDKAFKEIQLAKAQVLQKELIAQTIRVRQANLEVLNNYPQLIERMINIASGKVDKTSTRTQWEVTAWLTENIVKPLLELKEEQGAAELAYADREEEDFNPLDILPDLQRMVENPPR